RGVVGVEYAHGLGAAQLQEEVDLVIHVVGRHGAGRRYEDGRLALAHPRFDRLGERSDLVEARVQQPLEVGTLLGALELHPRADLRRIVDGLLGRETRSEEHTSELQSLAYLV